LLREAESALTPWMVVIVVARELIITGLRSFLENLGANFGAEWLGKIKMVLQCAALFAIFLALHEKNLPLFTWPRDILVWSMLIATALSGLQYLWKAFALLRKNT
jgi:phosphatidylglycerophosphate synthase